MASFDEHIDQVKRNLYFLTATNQQIANSYDWQVTVCFYTALHLVNAHLSKFNLQYRKHHDVNHALNPDVPLSISKLPEDEYDAYIALQRLSRRSRYLVNEKDDNLKTLQAFLTHNKHLSKAIRHLDKLLNFFCIKYAIKLEKIKFSCPGLTAADKLHYFDVR